MSVSSALFNSVTNRKCASKVSSESRVHGAFLGRQKIAALLLVDRYHLLVKTLTPHCFHIRPGFHLM